MGVVRTILLVAFIIICVLLVLFVIVQNEDNNGMGGVFGGGQSAAFGSHSASVLSKTTGVFVALFFVCAFGLALLNKAPSKSDSIIDAAAESGVTTEASGTSWIDQEEEVPAVEEVIVEDSAETATVDVSEAAE